MPVYEYQCAGCGRKFDVIASLAEKEAGLKVKCPKCGSARANQVFSRFTLLTGSKTDVDDSVDAGDEGGATPDSDDMGMDDFGDDDYDNLDESDCI